MDKLKDWFAGDQDALDLYERLVFVAHTWDDLVDGDKPVRADDVNGLVCNLLLYLPGNAVYRRFEADLRPLIYTSVVSYLSANVMQESGDAHQLEIAHYLRYAVANVVVFIIAVLNGMQAAPAIIARAMPVMIPERISDYVKEHAPC